MHSTTQNKLQVLARTEPRHPAEKERRERHLLAALAKVKELEAALSFSETEQV